MPKRKPTTVAPPAGDPFRPGDELRFTLKEDGTWRNALIRDGVAHCTRPNASVTSCVYQAVATARTLDH